MEQEKRTPASPASQALSLWSINAARLVGPRVFDAALQRGAHLFVSARSLLHQDENAQLVREDENIPPPQKVWGNFPESALKGEADFATDCIDAVESADDPPRGEGEFPQYVPMKVAADRSSRSDQRVSSRRVKCLCKQQANGPGNPLDPEKCQAMGHFGTPPQSSQQAPGCVW